MLRRGIATLQSYDWRTLGLLISQFIRMRWDLRKSLKNKVCMIRPSVGCSYRYIFRLLFLNSDIDQHSILNTHLDTTVISTSVPQAAPNETTSLTCSGAVVSGVVNDYHIASYLGV